MVEVRGGGGQGFWRSVVRSKVVVSGGRGSRDQGGRGQGQG